MEMENIVERVKSLCREHGEQEVSKRIDSFIVLSRGLESKKGKEYVELAILGFLEGILITLRVRMKDEEEKKRIEDLLREVKIRRRELESTAPGG